MASLRPLRPLRAILLVVILSSLAGVAPAIGAAGAPAAGWSTPIRVLPGIWTDVSAAVDSHGKAHVVAAGSTGVWYATDRSGSWVSRRILEHRSISEWRGVSLALDEDDRLTVALSEGFESEFGDLPGRIWRISDHGRPRGSFSAPAAVSPTSSTDPSLKTPGGHTYLARTGDVCYDVCEDEASRVWYQTDGPGGWIRRRLPGDASRPDLRVDAAGRPRLVYVVAGATRSRLVLASAGSRTGAFTTQVVARQGGSLVPRLVLDGADRPLVAWARIPFSAVPSSVSFARRTDEGWHVRSIGPGSVVAISVDASNRVHLAIGGDAGVREVLVRSTLSTTPIDAGSAVADVELRYPATGRALVAYVRDAPAAGVYIARR